MRLRLFFSFLLLAGWLLPSAATAQKPAGKPAPHPLYRDPVYDGAADPVVVWNKRAKKWWIFYTNRRATDTAATGVTWVHGTRIGIAESSDGGTTWTYRDTANINYRPQPGYTFWAPDVVEDKGTYHMFLTYVPGVFTDWNHPRTIVHLTSPDLLNWQYQSTLPLATDKVIDASVLHLPDGTWRLWYNNERDHKYTYYADSPDLEHWTDHGLALGERGEGPKVFRWHGQYWLIIDPWKGLAAYHSPDLLHWTAQPTRLLEAPGPEADDQAIGGHADVVVSGQRAYLFYFTHPGRAPANPAPTTSVTARRSVIQVVELHYQNGQLTCDRSQPTYVRLKAPK